MKLVLVEWKDACSGSYWNCKDHIENTDLIISTGILVREDDQEIELVPNIGTTHKLHQIAIPKGCILKNDPRFDMDGLAPWVKKGNIVESQRKRVVNALKPLAEEGKIIALGTGNHEEDIHLRHQFDMTRNICADLGVPYAGYQCFVVLLFKRRGSNESHQFIWHSWHGAGAAQTEGARVMRLVRLVNDIQAHIYTMGHLHAMTSHTPDRLIYSRGRVKSIRLVATITGSWLKTYNQPKEGEELNASYGERKGYKPSRIGCPIINIRPEPEEITVES